jgi:hypothetical protein
VGAALTTHVWQRLAPDFTNTGLKINVPAMF